MYGMVQNVIVGYIGNGDDTDEDGYIDMIECPLLDILESGSGVNGISNAISPSGGVDIYEHEVYTVGICNIIL